jgi:hypothetical protein
MSRESRDEAKSPTKPHGQMPMESGPLRRRSKRTKKPLPDGDAATPSLCGDSLSTDFNKFEWEIMYPHFVESGLLAPPERGND